jgi:hypothetical protein
MNACQSSSSGWQVAGKFENAEESGIAMILKSSIYFGSVWKSGKRSERKIKQKGGIEK